MSNNILICSICGNYTFSKLCPLCNSNCYKTKTLKFSLLDKYKLYRKIYMENKYG